MKVQLRVLPDTYAIYRFPPDTGVPDWNDFSNFFSVTKTDEEISIVAPQDDSLTAYEKVSKEWRILKVLGPLDFSLVGIIADIASVMKKVEVSIFTISTFDTDYIMVKVDKLDTAIKSLQEDGYRVHV